MSLVLDQVALTIAGRPLVKQVSLNLNPGEVVGLLGPNGAGKTTTFNLVTGLLRPDSGAVVMDEQSVAALSMPERARLGIAALAESLGQDMNIEELAAGIIEIANWNQANMIRQMTIQRGIDPRNFALLSFGGHFTKMSQKPP